MRPRYYKNIFKVAVSKIESDLGCRAPAEMMEKKKRKNNAKKKHKGKRRKPTVGEAKKEPRKPRAHARTYSWGGGLLTFKEKASSWQGTCPRCDGGHTNKRRRNTKCRITLAFHGVAEDADVQRRLKHWMNKAYAYDNRKAHQKFKPSIVEVPCDDDLLRSRIDAATNSVSDAEAEPPKKVAKRRLRRKVAVPLGVAVAPMALTVLEAAAMGGDMADVGKSEVVAAPSSPKGAKNSSASSSDQYEIKVMF